MPIQGTAADILKRAMIDVHARARTRASAGARMILTVHDELLFEAPVEERRSLGPRARHHVQAVPLTVPLDVDVGTGENWKEAKA